MRRLAALLALCTCISACATSGAHTQRSLGRHFEGDVWSGALSTQWQHADRRIPELALLASVPIAVISDSELNEDHPADISPDEHTATDTIPIALGVGAIAVGAGKWMKGDHGETLEAATEALALTAATTQLCKTLTSRTRPDGSSDSSFFSGHTSFAFAGTTVLLRELETDQGGAWNPWEVLAYAPATFVAIERVRADKHWASDVAVGAFVGTFLSNLVWDAHFPGDDEDRRTIFDAPSRVAWHWTMGEIDGAPAVGIAIGF